MSKRALKKGLAYMIRGDTASALVDFEFEGVRCLVPASEVRHLHDTCPGIEQALQVAGTFVERVENNAELRARTARCTAGCWTAFERSEQRAIVRGDESRRLDWEEDCVAGRRRLISHVRNQAFRNAVTVSE